MLFSSNLSFFNNLIAYDELGSWDKSICLFVHFFKKMNGVILSLSDHVDFLYLS